MLYMLSYYFLPRNVTASGYSDTEEVLTSLLSENERTLNKKVLTSQYPNHTVPHDAPIVSYLLRFFKPMALMLSHIVQGQLVNFENSTIVLCSSCVVYAEEKFCHVSNDQLYQENPCRFGVFD